MRLIQINFLFLFIGCFQPKKNNPLGIVEDNKFHLFYLTKKYREIDSSYSLNKKEISQFINQWNNSENVGMYKMMPEFWLSTHNSKGEVRTFRIRGNLIKESGDITFSISDSDYFKNLWKKAKQIPPPPPKPILFEMCDSTAEIAKSDYAAGIKEYIINGKVIMDDFEMYYSELMKDKYGIEIKGNCTPDFTDCYSSAMKGEIKKEFGENFMEETREKAKIEFENKVSN